MLWTGIYTSSVSLSYTYNKVGPSPFKPRFGSDISAAFQLAGLFGNVRYFAPVVQYKHFMAMKGLQPNTEGRNVIGFRLQASYIQGFSGDVAPPFARFYAGGDNDLRGFDVRAATPYAFIPVRAEHPAHQPRRDARSHRSQQLHPGQHHDSDPHLPPGIGGRRRQVHVQPRIPHSHRRARSPSPCSTTSTSLL